MTTHKKLTGTVIVVVTIAVMFGLHITFLVETTEANHSSSTCADKLHRVYGTSIANYYDIFSQAVLVTANCATCAGESPSPHARYWFYDRERITQWYEHKYLIGLFWSDCHTHTIDIDTYYS